MENRTFIVKGMSCSGCANGVESILRAQKGIHKANVNLSEKNVSVQFEPGQISFAAMQEAVHAIGYDLIEP